MLVSALEDIFGCLVHFFRRDVDANKRGDAKSGLSTEVHDSTRRGSLSPFSLFSLLSPCAFLEWWRCQLGLPEELKIGKPDSQMSERIIYMYVDVIAYAKMFITPK